MRDLTEGNSQHINVLPEPMPFANSLAQIIYLTSTIYSPAFSAPPLGPITFNSLCNNAAVRSLTEALEDTTNDEIWVRYPGILLWIVLTGYAAAEKLPDRSFFAMFVFRVGTSAAWWGMEAAGMAIRKFIGVKRRAEGVDVEVR
jgi:hypothetical protein